MTQEQTLELAEDLVDGFLEESGNYCTNKIELLACIAGGLMALEEDVLKKCHNDACGDALERLWKEIIIRRKPKYGEWQYPGEAYRHICCEFNDLEKALQRIRSLDPKNATEAIEIAREALK